VLPTFVTSLNFCYGDRQIIPLVKVSGVKFCNPQEFVSMLKQFSFGIAFDKENYEANENVEESPSPEWQSLVNQISTAISDIGLPITEIDRWEEFGSGRIFWGTRAECDAVKQVLAEFPVCIQEERNLDPGYYATSSAYYHVTEEGEITGWSASEPSHETLGKLNALPLDAYRIKTLPLALEQQFQQATLEVCQPPAQDADVQQDSQSNRILELETGLVKLDQQLSELHQALTQTINPFEDNNLLQEFKILQQQSAEKSQQLSEFEAKVADLEQQLQDWQAVPNAKIDPDDYASLQQQGKTQQEQIGILEHKVQASAQELARFQEVILQRVDRADYDALQQQLQGQVMQFSGLEQQILELQGQIQHWQTIANEKVGADDYASLQQQCKTQQDQIGILEHKVQESAQQLAHFQELILQRVDRADYDALQQQLQGQVMQFSEHKQQISELHGQIQHWQTIANAKVEVADYQILQQQTSSQEQRLIELTNYIQDLENQISQFRETVANKTDRADYEAVISQLDRLMAQKRQSWRSKLLAWFRRR
jgi:predicted  nucleic acid-binding Zn-ribbon protein